MPVSRLWRLRLRALVCGLGGSALMAACGLPDFEFVDQGCDPLCVERGDCETRCASGGTGNGGNGGTGNGGNGGNGTGGGCAVGFSDCDDNAANGCEADLRSNRAHCGSCQSDCSPGKCSGGLCTSIDCPSGYADCDQSASNACEVNLSSLTDCGFCGKRCSDINGQAACSAGKCSVVCDAGHADCDGNADTGCETAVATDEGNCGECGLTCANQNGSTRCLAGACSPDCAAGFDDCDANPMNGCETDVRSSLEHCRACGVVCNLAHASESCNQGICEIGQCDPGFSDCDGNPMNGCETDLGSVQNCGRCGNACGANGGSAGCSKGECTISCSPGRADCANGLADGCETNTTVSVLHCESCGNACSAPSGSTAACVDGACSVSTCASPLADCNGDNGRGGDSCETNVANDPANCGGCGIECFFPHGSALCVGRSCTLDACEAGFANCNGNAADGCETQLGRRESCLSCGNACSNAHGSTECAASGCKPSCAIGYGDCDGKPENGCETSLDTASNCGGCGMACTRGHASTSCSTGVCTITACASGYGDCDDEPNRKTGCETQLNSLAHCGACNTACGLPNASASCATGSCQLVACSAGYDDCSSTPGCETQLGTKANCSACGNVCQETNAHVTENQCLGSAGNKDCSPTCASGYKSCDTNPDNGCETSITTTANCGDCNVACNLPHALTEQCSGGACQVASCDSGWANCNPDHSDGCERPVSTDPLNCGGCNTVCSSNHGTPGCNAGTCSISCATGYGNCNGNVADGCEKDVRNDAANCGACNAPCNGFCVNSACRPHLDIQVVNSSTRGAQATAGANLSLTHALATPAGNYRLVLVGVAGRGNGTAGKPSGVTYNTQPMTLLREMQSGNQAWAGVYALADAALPPAAGNYGVVVTAGSAQSTFGLVGNVVELRNVQQATAYLDASSGANHNNCMTDKPTASLTTVSDGALVYGIAGIYGEVTPISGIAASGQTVTLQLASGSGLGGLAGYVNNVSPARAVTVGWNADNCLNSCEALVSLKPASTP